MNWWPGYMDEEDLELDENFETLDNRRPEVNIDWQDALEKNKTRDTCILCGKDTIDKPLFSSVIKYCSCVEEHSKKEEKGI